MPEHDDSKSASEQIDAILADLPEWKAEVLSRMRGLFNGSLGGNTMRAIDIQEGDEIDAEDFKSLVRAAVARNASSARG